MKLTNQTILITGGAGFIGSHTAITLSKHNKVTVIDSFASSVRTKEELSKFGIQVVPADIRNIKTIEPAFRSIDLVLHFAVACVRKSLSDEQYVHDVNAGGTLSVLKISHTAKVKRFVYISSSEAYGTATTSKMKETHGIHPTTIYGASKYVGELYTHVYHNYYHLPTITVRPFNTYGPFSHFDGVYGEVIPRFVISIFAGKPLTIFGDGSQSRDFTYIEDTVSGILQASSSDRLIGDTINIACGKEVSILSLGKYISEIIGVPFVPHYLPPRPNDVARHAADISKAKKILEFSPKTDIRQGLKKYIEWIKKTYPDPNKLYKKIPEKNW